MSLELARQALPARERLIRKLAVAGNFAPEPVWRLKGATLAQRSEFDIRCHQPAMWSVVNVDLDGMACKRNFITALGNPRRARQRPQRPEGRWRNLDFFIDLPGVEEIQIPPSTFQATGTAPTFDGD